MVSLGIVVLLGATIWFISDAPHARNSVSEQQVLPSQGVGSEGPSETTSPTVTRPARDASHVRPARTFNNPEIGDYVIHPDGTTETLGVSEPTVFHDADGNVICEPGVTCLFEGSTPFPSTKGSDGTWTVQVYSR